MCKYAFSEVSMKFKFYSLFAKKIIKIKILLSLSINLLPIDQGKGTTVHHSNVLQTVKNIEMRCLYSIHVLYSFFNISICDTDCNCFLTTSLTSPKRQNPDYPTHFTFTMIVSVSIPSCFDFHLDS